MNECFSIRQVMDLLGLVAMVAMVAMVVATTGVAMAITVDNIVNRKYFRGVILQRVRK